MKTVNRAPEPMSSIFSRLDGVRMSEPDRDIAKAYLRKTEAVLDLIWLAGARIRAAIVRTPGMRSKAGTRLSSQKRIAVQLP